MINLKVGRGSTWAGDGAKVGGQRRRQSVVSVGRAPARQNTTAKSLAAGIKRLDWVVRKLVGLCDHAPVFESEPRTGMKKGGSTLIFTSVKPPLFACIPPKTGRSPVYQWEM